VEAVRQLRRQSFEIETAHSAGAGSRISLGVLMLPRYRVDVVV